VFFHRAAAQQALLDLGLAMLLLLAVRRRRGNVGDLFGHRVLASDSSDADVSGLASLGEGVVATVEILALLRGK
jgi:hypothetical protein